MQLAVGALIVVSCTASSYKTALERNLQLQPPLRGVWQVDQFALDGTPLQPLMTDLLRWQRVILDAPDIFTIEFMDGSREQFFAKWNEQTNKVSLWQGHSLRGTVTVESVDVNRMVPGAEIEGHRVQAQFRPLDLSDPIRFRLINHEFHWIN